MVNLIPHTTTTFFSGFLFVVRKLSQWRYTSPTQTPQCHSFSISATRECCRSIRPGLPEFPLLNNIFVRVSKSNRLELFVGQIEKQTERSQITHKLDGTRPAAVHGYPSASYDLDLWPLTFWPHNLINTSMNPDIQLRMSPKLGEIPLSDFEIRCSQGFRDAQTHSLTHSRTDRPECRMPPVPFFKPFKVQWRQKVAFWSVQCHPGLTYIFNFWHSGTLALRTERQSARMSEIKKW